MPKEVTEITMIAVEKLHPNKDNPRKDLGDLSELTESIKKNGVMQNLTVVRNEDEYTVLIGHRRLAAAKAAGLSEVPCKVVEKMDKKEQLAIMLCENIQRSDLTAREQADGFQMMLDLGETVSSISQRSGFSESTVRHRIELAKLDKEALQEKTEMFQLALTDLMKLERVTDIKERNLILQRSSNGRELEDGVQRWVRQNKIATNTPLITQELQALGVIPETDDVRNNYYSSKYEHLVSIRPENSEKVPDSVKDKIEAFIKENPKNSVWYTNRYGYEITIVVKKKVVREKKEETDFDRAKKRNKQMKEIHKKLSECHRAVIAEVYEGKRKKISEKEKQEVIAFCWPVIRTMYGITSDGFTIATGKHYYDDKDGYQEYLNAPMWMQMLAAAGAKLEVDELFTYSNCYRSEIAEKTKEFHNLLHKLYGFKIEDDELLQYLEGTHELYAEPEKEVA